ncbi:Ig-like domain-containing protein [Haloferax sp. Atlit-48N]|uniref:Ig-like domain-containing protein n=1 Tax=Haloferax sp. Atlit-48N TaxID=2077198 RepID=A0ACD5I029_9EURY|nr:Ig-like domain-containing protein [Haloferax sp. Atlit-48N]
MTAADGDLVVGSEHTTDSDFDDATELTNVSVAGSGDSANLVFTDGQSYFDSFEDQPADSGIPDGWSQDAAYWVPDAVEVSSTYATDGSQSVYIGDLDGTEISRLQPDLHPIPPTTDPVSTDMRYVSADDSGGSIRLALSEDGTRVALVQLDGDSLINYNGAEQTITSVPSADEWVSVRITDIDPVTDTFTVKWETASDNGTVTGLSMWRDMSSGWDTATLGANDGAGYFDDFAHGAGSSYSGRYISSTHNVTDPAEGRVDLSLDNATADVIWQAESSGTWTNVSSATHSTSGTKTADLSSTSADQWRVRVDFETAGSEPTAGLGRDAVYFPVTTPDISAASSSPSGGEVVRYSTPTLSVNISDDDLGTAQGEELTLTWRVDGSVVDTTTRTSNGTASITAPSLSDGNHTWSVTVDDSYGETVSSTEFDFEVQHVEPTITELSPSDNTSLSTRDIELSANLTDSDFAFDGDELTAEFIVDGGVVGSETLTSNGTASTMYTMDGGSASWSVRVSDTYGNTVTSDNRTIRSPSTLTIRNVSTGDPITGSAQVTAKLYSGELIFTKNTSGTIDLTGVPVERGYIIEVTVDGYVTRTVAIESVFEQGDVYLLPETADTVYQEMTLNDQTGDFEASSTVLYVERPIERNGTIEWRVVTGDYFGADSVFKTTLEQDQRYRLVIENDDGDRRELGAYIAAVNGTAPLDVGTIQWQAPKGDTYQWDAFVDDETSALRVMYSDPEDETTDFDIVVHERGNASNVLFESTATNLSSFQRTEPLSQSELEQDWAVNITLERNSQMITIDEPISSAASIRTPVPIDTRWATLGGLVLLVALAAAFPSTLSRVGAVAVVSVATGITWLGWVDIPMSVIGLSGAVALLGLAASFNSY